ncbi:BnaC02g43270D [Brassica napus]|uniref:BnaC02g43270D protein n=1 Tax=Brassica napus TaxID=3708 RepID=A0A078IBT4_BRANA|nr:BnaC02g43270D [Brassica napus]
MLGVFYRITLRERPMINR